MDVREIPRGAVVVGCNGTHQADQALDWAAHHAATEGRDLVLLHAVEGSRLTVFELSRGGVDPTPYLREMDAAGQALLDTALARVEPALPPGTVHTVLTRTDARGALLSASERASAVVVGSRGRGPVKSKVLGSVSAALAGHSRCPTVVVRPQPPGAVREGILVGCDGTEGSLAVLEFAYRQAALSRMPLTVLHTYWGPLVRKTGDETPTDSAREDGDLALAESLAGLGEEYPDVSVERHVTHGNPVDRLLTFAESAALVVVGHHHRDPLGRLEFGSVGMDVLEHASTAVALVPES